ncbi:MAG: metallophosphoesterase family protein [Phycisphaerales bacterium]|jgi:diadenosine tetraphosphatase ApaH/serine/threonine PP2A family protein phosphatase|nr:metallophosphoesterase family protein [Planctomycetota bacterium]
MQTRLAIISDVHGNAEALTAVLEDIDRQGLHDVACLGDTVGYGASPSDCVSMIAALGQRLVAHVRGNHEDALFDPDAFAEMNAVARAAIRWTRDRLSRHHLDWLRHVPGGADLGCLQAIHDSPMPAANTYLRDRCGAAVAFQGVAREICLVGHTHVPLVFRTSVGTPDAAPKFEEIVAELLHEDEAIPLESGHRFILNPGSVGQPRDADCRASYGVLDLERRTFTIRRIEYDIASAQRAVEAAGLPERISSRLAVGA